MKQRVFCLFVCLLLLGMGACKKPEEKQGGLSKPMAENVISLQAGKTLEGLQTVGEDGRYYCNLQENLIGTYSNMPEDLPVLVCKDPVYGITYYVNYGRDYFIYAKRGDTSECVVEISARDLYCREGVLYFRTEDYDLYEFSSFADGAVLAYDPTDGSVKVVIDEPTFEMAVYPDGILYVVNEELMNEGEERSVRRHEFFYSFENGESKEFPPPMRTMSRWKEYQLQLVVGYSEDEDGAEQWEYRLETPQGEDGGILPGWSKLPSSYRITETGIYYIDVKQDTLMHYDVETGALETMVELAFPSNFPNAFLLFGETAYFGNGIRYSFADGRQYLVKIGERETAQVGGLYTDGEEIFILADGMLWLYEEKRVEESGYEITHIPGRSVIIGCYEAELHPLGE